MLTHGHVQPVAPARVVVMGAGGFVGGAIVQALAARKVPVLGLARADVDLQAPGAAEKLTALLRPDDAFVAVSAIAPVKNLAMLKDNLTIIEALAGALKARPVAHVLNIGSDAIYGDSEKPMSEAGPTAPGSLHGVMHLTRELALAEAAGAAPFATLRPTLIYGAADPHDGYGPNKFRRLAKAGQEIVLFGEGEERRDHVHVGDVAELAARILMHHSRGALNAATGTVVSFREIAELVVAQFPAPVAIKGSPRRGPMPHNGYRAFDPAATKAAFPDFAYLQPAAGFALVHRLMLEMA
ncbi:MAG TPA: NAD-dependent epimerase/dehydratase family protein [Alphaproteobacteria bacterium]|nr:NAD-dependent epimerase/dehydratase family protein [Alphaproteobacteria bacterium]